MKQSKNTDANKNNRLEILSELITRYYNGSSDDKYSDQTRQLFAEWLLEEEESDHKLDAIMQLLEGQSKENGTDIEYRVNEILKRIGYDHSEQQPAKSRRLSRTLGRIAAVVLPLLVAGGVWLFTHNNSEDQTFTNVWNVAYGVTETAALPDSTYITVNSGSKIDVSLSATERIVELTGESFFKVSRHEDRPFVVRTRDLTVTVLGTEFNIEAYPERTQTVVTLTSGRIRVVTHDGEEFIMSPNELFVYDRQTQHGEIKREHSVDDSVGWLSGRHICNLLTLPEMFKVIERCYDVEIEIDPSVELTDFRYTTEFSSEVTLNQVMDSWRLLTEKFDYQIVNDKKIRIVKP